MSTESFYADLPVLDDFIEITNSENFKSVPRDWYIIITDIVGSTKAIELGRYKDVNILGACSIVAVLNIAGKIEIPFVFGGDGAAVLIPPSLFAEARQALLATRQRARIEFGMDLRVGAVPVPDVAVAGYDIKVAKLKVSENYCQAAFNGGGLSYATKLVKDPIIDRIYNYENTNSNINPDFSGLECRWQDIPSKHGETVSLIVNATSRDSAVTNKIYQEVIEKIQSIYGSEDYWHPISKENLRLAFSYKYLRSETKLRAEASSLRQKLAYFSKIIIENFLGWVLMKFKIQFLGVDWGDYKEKAIAATDYKKFDDMLQMVIDGNESQRKKLNRYLERNYKKGKLVYGLHVSDRALMTCLVFERSGRQVHFVDGADGGYASAAKAMKERIKRKRSSDPAFLNWRRSTSLLL
jgi:hypothetical protein